MAETQLAPRAEVFEPRREHRTQIVLLDPEKAGDPGVTALIKHTGDGSIKAAQIKVPLSVGRGELYEMKMWGKGGQLPSKFPLTAQGYYKQNKYGAVAIATPPTVLDDEGKTRPNPFICWDSNEVVYVRVRKIAVGRSAMGSLTGTDYTLTYHLRNYYAQDILSKYLPKGRDATPRDWGLLMPFTAELPKDKAGCWHKVPIPGGLALWVNLANKEVIGIVQEHQNRQRFAERNAVTICERNLLKRFYPTTFVERDNATVTVVAWSELDRSYQAIADQLGSSTDGQLQVDGEPVDLSTATEVVEDPDDVHAAISGDPEEVGEVPEGEDEPPVAGVSVPQSHAQPDANTEQLGALRETIRTRIAKVDGDTVAGIMAGAGYSKLGDIADETDAAKLTALAKELETAILQATQQAMTGKQQQGVLIPGTQAPEVEPPSRRRR